MPFRIHKRSKKDSRQYLCTIETNDMGEMNRQVNEWEKDKFYVEVEAGNSDDGFKLVYWTGLTHARFSESTEVVGKRY
jgi:hypothetical protein